MEKIFGKTMKPKFKVPMYKPDDLALVRFGLGLKQKDVGSVMNVDKHVISSIEVGGNKPNGAPIMLYGLVLEEICKERGTTFKEVLKTQKLQCI